MVIAIGMVVFGRVNTAGIMTVTGNVMRCGANIGVRNIGVIMKSGDAKIGSTRIGVAIIGAE